MMPTGERSEALRRAQPALQVRGEAPTLEEEDLDRPASTSTPTTRGGR